MLSSQGNSSTSERIRIGWLLLNILVEVDIEDLEVVMWKEFRYPVVTSIAVIVIPKPKKIDILSINSWRCISLINNTCKF